MESVDRHAFLLYNFLRTGLGHARALDLDGMAVQMLDGPCEAEECFHQINVDIDVQVFAVTHEELVRACSHEELQVARRLARPWSPSPSKRISAPSGIPCSM